MEGGIVLDPTVAEAVFVQPLLSVTVAI